MAALNTLALTRLGGLSGVWLSTGVSTTIWTVPMSRTAFPREVVFRNPTASLAGATNISITQFRQNFDLSGMTTTQSYAFVTGGTFSYTGVSAGVPIQVQAGAGVSANVIVDIFGYLA